MRVPYTNASRFDYNGIRVGDTVRESVLGLCSEGVVLDFARDEKTLMVVLSNGVKTTFHSDLCTILKKVDE